VLPLTETRWNPLMNEVKAVTAESARRQPDGEFEVQKRVYQYHLFPVKIREKEPDQTGIVLWDITEKKQLQDQLIQAEKLASLGTLVSGMAHEINNAVQAMEGTGRLTLATRHLGDIMSIMISDTGCGIPKALLNRIFDPFFTTKDPGKGTALGLSIVYTIVSRYAGTIRVESEEGKGTTFTIQFPAGGP